MGSALSLLHNAIIKRPESDKEKGEIASEIDCHVTASHVAALITGMITMAKAGFPQKELEKLIINSAEILLKTKAK